jgi:hypothetical protein
MPIDYSKYPPNWKTEIRPRILERASNCCENCGVRNSVEIRRNKLNPAHYMYQEDVEDKPDIQKQAIDLMFDKPIKVILTVAHLDHDPENWEVSDDRLKALCQRCHLNYDRGAEK